MSKRIVLAGVAAGVAMFAWGTISHVVLPLGEVGIKEMPNEEPVLAAMREHLREPGFYYYPGMRGDRSAAGQETWAKKARQGPLGIVVHRPAGGGAMEPGQLLTELGTNILAALVAAFLLSWVGGALAGFGARVLFVTTLGLLPGLEVDLSYWNWYGFPTNYTLAAIADHLLGWTAAGLVLAAILKEPQPPRGGR